MGQDLKTEKMPGHWLLARLGKRVLRPGGFSLTSRLLDALDIGSGDDVVEFAPGLGVTARVTLTRRPRSYIAVERDAEAADAVRRFLRPLNDRCVVGSAEDTGLPDGCASVVYGEAMLSMQTPPAKAKIIAEAARLLRPRGRYGIHELALVPDGVDATVKAAMEKDLSEAIHHAVRPLTAAEWSGLLESRGLRITALATAPMHLLEPHRIVQDEGIAGALKFAWNVARDAKARRRVLAMRAAFRKYARHLAAIMLVGVKP